MDGRDNNGRFIKGHAKTGGRSSRQYEDQFKGLWNKKFTPKKFEVILDKLFSMAAKGDMAAIKLALEYSMGKPIQKNEITGADNQPLTIRVVYDEDNNE